jgi:hypothetical protein
MATANRTIQFLGYAYGSVPVQLNAHINGELVFSGTVNTTDAPLPLPNIDVSSAPVLFSVENSALFPTDFSGSYPMTVSVATGSGILLTRVLSNYIPVDVYHNTWLENSTITGTTLNIGSYRDPSVVVHPGMTLGDSANLVTYGTKVVSGSDLTWTVDIDQNVSATTIVALDNTPTQSPGSSTVFSLCYSETVNGVITTTDPRSNVAIDGVAQNPQRDGEIGAWSWILPQGSTLACDLSVNQGLA